MQYHSCVCIDCIHSISQNGVTIESMAMLTLWAGLRQTKHMVTGSTPWLRFISICLLSHYMKDTLLRGYCTSGPYF